MNCYLTVGEALYLFGFYVKYDGLPRDYVAVLLQLGFTGEGRDILDLVDLDDLRFASKEMITSFGLLLKNSRLTVGDGPLQNVIMKKEVNYICLHAERALLDGHIPAIGPLACVEVNLNILSFKFGWLVAVTVQGRGEPRREKKNNKEKEI